MIRAVVRIVAALAGVSVAVGIILALVVVIWAHDTAPALRIIRDGYYALAGLFPIALWFTLYAMREDEEYDAAYGSVFQALLTTVHGAVVGSILGAGPIFLAVVVNTVELLSTYEADDFGPAVRGEIIWSRLLIAVGAAVISALPLGLWVYHARSELKEE